jgi:ferredoxin
LCPLGLNIPVMLRHIEGGRMTEAAALVRQALPLAGVLGRLCHHPCEQGCRRGHWDDPAAIRDMEKFVTDEERKIGPPHVPARKADSGKSVVVIGAGPTGLSAAIALLREGHRVTLVDRQAQAGGSLRAVAPAQLPPEILDAEIAALGQLGVDFKLGVTLGNEIRLEGLMRGFDALVVATGETSLAELRQWGLPTTDRAIRVDPNNCQSELPGVFCAGSVVRPQRQLVKALAEGRVVAECVHRFLSGQPVRRPEKTFSSVMGRLNPGELRTFLRQANGGASVSPCDRCAGHNRAEAALESSRCLHCDCRSSGNCVLQHYAQVYGADANRFRSERRMFDQQVQPGGIVFEPGKCILCGICVKLTELAAEPLGLAFVGRGFDVRVSAPFNEAIAAGLRKVGAECVEHCPTGALAFQSESVAASATIPTPAGPPTPAGEAAADRQPRT